MRFFATHSAPANDPAHARVLIPAKLVARPDHTDSNAADLAFTLDLPRGVSLEGLSGLVLHDGVAAPFTPVVAEKFGESLAVSLEFFALPSSWSEVSATFTLAVTWDSLLETGLGLSVPVALEGPGVRLQKSIHDPLRVPIESALGVQLLLADESGRFGFSPLELAPGEECTVRIRYQREERFLVKDLRVMFDPYADADEVSRASTWHLEVLGIDVAGARATTCEPRVYTAEIGLVNARYSVTHELFPDFSDDAVWVSGFEPSEVPYLIGFDLGWRDARDWHFYLPRAEELYVDCRVRVPEGAAPGTVSGPVAAISRATLVRAVGEQQDNATTYDIAFLPRVTCRG